MHNIIFINFEEFVKGSYKSVDAWTPDGDRMKFDSGDVVKDWITAVLWLRGMNRYHIVCSSSVDDFLNDHDCEYELDLKSFRIVRNKSDDSNL